MAGTVQERLHVVPPDGRQGDARVAARTSGSSAPRCDAWDRRVRAGQMGGMMDSFVGGLGRRRTLQALADWTDRINAGELPPVPPRPQGLERNVVISLWDWSDQYAFVHDTISTDKRDPLVNGNGRVYSVGRFRAPDVIWLDPVAQHDRSARGADPRRRHAIHEPADDDRAVAVLGRRDHLDREGEPAQPDDGPPRAGLADAQLPQPGREPRLLHSRIDAPVGQGCSRSRASGASGGSCPSMIPKTSQFQLIDTCFGNHHLQFAEDRNHTLWTSGGDDVAGWVNTRCSTRPAMP